MKRFNLDDEVIVVDSKTNPMIYDRDKLLIGKVGKVVKVLNDENSYLTYLIEFTKNWNNELHDGNFNSNSKNKWYIGHDRLRLYIKPTKKSIKVGSIVKVKKSYKAVRKFNSSGNLLTLIGKTATVLSINGKFYRLSFNNTEVIIHSSFLKLIG